MKLVANDLPKELMCPARFGNGIHPSGRSTFAKTIHFLVQNSCLLRAFTARSVHRSASETISWGSLNSSPGFLSLKNRCFSICLKRSEAKWDSSYIESASRLNEKHCCFRKWP